MTWPTGTISTTNLDAGTDSPASARADIKQMADNVNAIKDEFQDGDGAKLSAIEANANNYSHPATHSISEVSTLQTALDAKVDDSQVLTNVPAGALFTDNDTVYTHPTTDGNLHVPATSTTNNGKVLTAGATAGSLSWETPSAGSTGGETCVFYVDSTSGGNYGGESTAPYRRTINNMTDPSSYYSVSGYGITLPAGTYMLEHLQTVINAVDGHYDTALANSNTNGTILSSSGGGGGYNEIGTQNEGIYAFGGVFTLATSTTVDIRGVSGYYVPTQYFKLTHIVAQSGGSGGGGADLGNLEVDDTELSVSTTDGNLYLEANGTGIAMMSNQSEVDSLPGNNTRNLMLYKNHSSTFGTRHYSNQILVDAKIDGSESDSNSSSDRWRNILQVDLDLNGKDSTNTSSYLSRGPQNAFFTTVYNSGSSSSTLGNANGAQNVLTAKTTGSGNLTITESAAHSASIETNAGSGTTLTFDTVYGYSSRGFSEGGSGTNDVDKFCHFHARGGGASYELAFVADTTAGQSRLNDIFLQNKSSDPSLRSNGSHIYAKDDAGSSEVYVQDEAGNVTKISPHNDAGDWEYYSINKNTGKTVRVNMERMIRKLEEFTGETFFDED